MAKKIKANLKVILSSAIAMGFGVCMIALSFGVPKASAPLSPLPDAPAPPACLSCGKKLLLKDSNNMTVGSWVIQIVDTMAVWHDGVQKPFLYNILGGMGELMSTQAYYTSNDCSGTPYGYLYYPVGTVMALGNQAMMITAQEAEFQAHSWFGVSSDPTPTCNPPMINSIQVYNRLVPYTLPANIPMDLGDNWRLVSGPN